ncbi:alpha/beta hydrolase [Micromonospora sp. CA-259024]|uniref:alpha/beta hydrolase n=1 Tax=Micromonospora sp. CA-259024 TaxID=3239965 RepID=UPI003D8CF4C4
MSTQHPTLLLVHGAWHRPETWDLLRSELNARGYQSRVVKLPTTGPNPRGGMHDDAAVVRAAIEEIDGPVVVVAHSYGGIPVSEGATGLPKVQHLVYLAAYQLDQDESMFSFHGVPEPEDKEGLFPIIADPRNSLYADVPDAEAEHAVSRLVDQRLRAFTDRVGEPAWHKIPSTYIIMDQDKAIPVPEQERMAARAGNIRRMPSSHSPFLSRPADLAALLDEVITGRA